jgi:hypothetical protein
MPSASDFRRQADICLALSLIDPDNMVSSVLRRLAQDDANQAAPWSPAPTVTTEAGSDSEADSQTAKRTRHKSV